MLGLGAYSPQSQISVRVWTFEPGEEVGPAFFGRRLASALEERRPLVESNLFTGYRIVNAESDGLPGLIVDRYGSFLVCQFLAAGSERWRADIVSQLAALIPCDGIYERSDADVRSKEGLEPRTGVLAGVEPPELVDVREGDCSYLVDVRHGHKTGFYLDQRDNRTLLAGFTKGVDVLDCFTYTGGFSVRALKGGAKNVCAVDSSGDALALARRNAEHNGQDLGRLEMIDGDVFHVLRKFRDIGRSFDVIVLDPPKFVVSRKQLEGASRGYKDINLLAFKLLRPGGVLFTFSCSSLMLPDLFQKIVADAALEAGREAQIIRRLSQGTDHPVALSFPEGAYLKGLVCRVKSATTQAGS
jgi:23S rRNA (cytosine1962-C5)-methyltransferase